MSSVAAGPESVPDPSSNPYHRDVRVIAIVGYVHAISHFFHLILVPLFPYLIADFGYSYTELGLLMTAFFVVSGLGQTAAGFLVDRVGAIPVLIGTLFLFACAALVLATSVAYWGLFLGMVLAGLGNAPFHPIDFSIMNSRVRPHLLGRAYAVHGISGTLGWAVAPIFLGSLAAAFGWRMALVGAAVLAASGCLLVLMQKSTLRGLAAAEKSAASNRNDSDQSVFSFLKVPGVWLSFLFFALYAFSLGGVQSFAPAAAGQLHGMDIRVVAYCLTVYMVFAAIGAIPGGFIAASPERAEKLIGIGFGFAALASFSILFINFASWFVPVMFGVMGFFAGFANPSRDLLVKRAAPPGATGRVYGVVYSGLDVGMAGAPALFGLLMDRGRPDALWLTIGCLQLVMIGFAFLAGYQSRPALRKAAANV